MIFVLFGVLQSKQENSYKYAFGNHGELIEHE